MLHSWNNKNEIPKIFLDNYIRKAYVNSALFTGTGSIIQETDIKDLNIDENFNI